MLKRRSRKAQHRRQNCWCLGWWWQPHRIGSKASSFTRKTTGTVGCVEDGVPF